MQYRFWFHYNRQTKQMTVHFRGKCLQAADVKCNAPCSTHHRPQQPHLVMRGWASKVIEERDVLRIEAYE